MTSVKIYFRQTVFVSLVVSLLFYSVYAQEVIERKVCANVYAAVGKTVCDDNATCLEGDGAISCECEEGALGDGWAISSGCVEVEGPALDYSGVRDKIGWHCHGFGTIFPSRALVFSWVAGLVEQN
ncbi:uncharacterized protein LOC111343138 isoform X2 [Stylophora pistillata]|uniref:uncharacterized protein LOC111343138 isoform X2 n=1 Tax=Stylophora pistillata TaxID=50429 RepID=UPI000C04AC58|nr:uncharacterized protein LOC111343138 isoform X2 [Stylophora pistillata]